MITIPCINVGTPSVPLLAPQALIPANAIAVTCDGRNYTVYEPGDTVPAPPSS